ncbi:hypothetical protein [Actinacidiphila oryziradicis]|jgi:hypothetical protein|uniref:Uncharacterized protein n=1 Tax=Actinacidiphila oryziradicis TaxID=2571141 RepID=A0A4U0SGR6_9ACTN|nr:hypothetical protein [Actinacidiphila oryziradicis]TJZ99444.1 hypothetical protein FCI23_45830 [Actinacidiphila oryziradicis]
MAPGQRRRGRSGRPRPGAAGKAGKTILDNGGHGFSVLAAPDLPAYQLGGPHNDKLVPAKYKDIVLGS